MNRENIIIKLKSLEKMTVKNGCTTAEAKTAKTLYLKLKAQYSITNDELGIKSDLTASLKDVIKSYFNNFKLEKPQFRFNFQELTFWQLYIIGIVISLPFAMLIFNG